ncbi:unnamed protein product, partial [Didymodactylos carnosus]
LMFLTDPVTNHVSSSPLAIYMRTKRRSTTAAEKKEATHPQHLLYELVTNLITHDEIQKCSLDGKVKQSTAFPSEKMRAVEDQLNYLYVKSYRKIDDLEREIIIGLTQKFGNSATAITNYIRASGTTYGELSSYYQSLKFPSARKRIYDILTNSAKSVATQRVLDPLCLQPQATDKFDYATTNDGIEETDVDRVTFIQQMLADFTA